MVAAAVVGSSVVGSLLKSDAAPAAAQQQSVSTDSSVAQQQQILNDNRAIYDGNRQVYEGNKQYYTPSIDAGNAANAEISRRMGTGELGGNFTGADYLANRDPGYQFQLDQGSQALQNSQAAHDGVLSGSALKGLISYNQGMASTGYQNAYERWLATQKNSYGQLSGQAQMGLQSQGTLANSAGALAGAGSASADTAARSGQYIGDAMTQGGNARASGIMGSANHLSDGLQQAGNGYMMRDFLNNPTGSNYDMGFNGQNNPANQAGLDRLIGSF